jgi:transmembrane sensor
VTVVEGSVQVRPGEAGTSHSQEAVMLAAGDRLSFGDGGLSVQALSAGTLDDALAWRRGWIVFNGVPLAEALPRVAHFHGRTITVSGGAGARRISGRFNLDDLDQFFKDVEQAMPEVYVTRGPEGDPRVSLRTEH